MTPPEVSYPGHFATVPYGTTLAAYLFRVRDTTSVPLRQGTGRIIHRFSVLKRTTQLDTISAHTLTGRRIISRGRTNLFVRPRSVESVFVLQRRCAAQRTKRNSGALFWQKQRSGVCQNTMLTGANIGSTLKKFSLNKSAGTKTGQTQ